MTTSALSAAEVAVSGKSAHELMAIRDAALKELNSRGIALTRSDPAGHLAELVAAAALWSKPHRDAQGAPCASLDVREWASTIRWSWYSDDSLGPAMSTVDQRVDLAIPWIRVRESLGNTKYHDEFCDFAERRQLARRTEDIAREEAWCVANGADPGELPSSYRPPRKVVRRLAQTGQPLQALWKLARIQVKARTQASDLDFAIDARRYLPDAQEVGPVDLVVCVNIDPMGSHLVKEAWLVTAEALERYRVGRLTWGEIRSWRTARVRGVFDMRQRMRRVALPDAS